MATSKKGQRKPLSLLEPRMRAGAHLAGVTVENFKSIRDPLTIEFAPLTLLAGANSSGKSSMLQSLLLLKQTLDVSYDPGPILLDGANTRVNRASDLVFGSSRSGVGGSSFAIALKFSSNVRVGFEFDTQSKKRPVELTHMTVFDPEARPTTAELKLSTPDARLRSLVDEDTLEFLKGRGDGSRLSVIQDRFFLNVVIEQVLKSSGGASGRARFNIGNFMQGSIESALTGIIHLPGLRGNPERAYPRTAFSTTFPGQFQDYVASVVAHWQQERKDDLAWVAGHLARLGLTWKVSARDVDDTRVELQVGRLPHARQGGAHDLVNIADVGLGVSQVLPVLVALRAARPKQLVLVEQPEIHLHPRAQALLAYPLAEAASRGVHVVVETHSGLLVRQLQTLMAQNILDYRHVRMHWFARDAMSGVTSARSVQPDELGGIGDWPIDFDEVTLDTESAYLDAVTLHES